MTTTVVTNPTTPLLTDLPSMTDARLWGEALARDMNLYRSGRLAWEHLSPSCILYGPPGTGKTMFAEALAATCGIPLVAASLPAYRDPRDVMADGTLDGLAKTFALALKHAPSICFIDRIDSLLARDDGDGSESFIRNTRSLLDLFDGRAPDHEGFVLVGACNRRLLPERDLFRSGRIHRLIPVTLPSQKELEAIIAFHLTPEERAHIGTEGHDGRSGLSTIAPLCAGMSGRDVTEFLRMARGIARCSGRPLSNEHWIEAIDPTSKRPTRETQLRRVVREAGHAVVAVRLKLLPDMVASVVPHSGLVGRLDPDALTGSVTLTLLLDLLAILLAGRAAEEIVFGEASVLPGGRSDDSDIAKATAIAHDAVSRFGLSQQRPLAWQPLGHDPAQSPATTAEVAAMLEAAHAFAKQQVETDLGYLFAIAQALIDARAIGHADLMALKGSSNSAPAIGKADFRRHLDAAFARSTRRREILFQPFRVIEPAKASPTIEATEAEFAGFRGQTAEQLEARLPAARAQEIAEAEAEKPPMKRFFQRLIRSGADR